MGLRNLEKKLDKIQEYNSEPVYYCKTCLSLRVVNTDIDNDGFDYCDECGSTDIGSCSIHEWIKLYRTRYNKDFLEL